MNFNDMKNVLLQNPEVLKEYNNLKPEYDKIYTNLSDISKENPKLQN